MASDELIFISFYTTDTPYEDEVAYLRDSLDAHGLAHDIRGVPSKGSWIRNAHHIPIFCREMLDEHRGRPLVWLDADAVVNRAPVLFERFRKDERPDFACHHLMGRELLNGTMYISQRCRYLFDAWIAADEKEPTVWEQKILEANLDTWLHGYDLTFEELPPEYCLIFDHQQQRRACSARPVIVHNQASRRFKRIVGHKL